MGQDISCLNCKSCQGNKNELEFLNPEPQVLIHPIFNLFLYIIHSLKILTK